ncbi:MAG: hypothetical protein EKK51_11075 [Mycolicibacterium sp.]|uniref:hypothetical protein n=1 Tax=Mycolicibacterium sp. TaxID=2320850 RepID=UPI000FA8A8DD|nr:hypothetical protein [Mycolicibacterium sp.]RUP31994.1 MAG: hypothetical protein EKK51_11075 [Mycolicibacterium sp.]
MTTAPPDPAAGYATLAQYLADIAIRTANESTKVLTAAAAKLDSGKHTVDDCYQTMTALAGVSLLGWIEAATSILAGPGFANLAVTAYSEWYAVPGKTTQDHSVKLLGPLSRSVSPDVIIPAFVAFEVKKADGKTEPSLGGKLPAGTTYFRMLVNRFGKHSGCYVGKAAVTPLPDASGAGGGPAVELDVEIDL